MVRELPQALARPRLQPVSLPCPQASPSATPPPGGRRDAPCGSAPGSGNTPHFCSFRTPLGHLFQRGSADHPNCSGIHHSLCHPSRCSSFFSCHKSYIICVAISLDNPPRSVSEPSEFERNTTCVSPNFSIFFIIWCYLCTHLISRQHGV